MKKLTEKIRNVWHADEPADFENAEGMSGERESISVLDVETAEILHAEPGALQAVKGAARGHGEQTVLPDDCEFGDNDLCYVEA